MALMADPVKRRSYDATGRRAQSDKTRQRVITAARDLFVADGYRATTIAAIAARAQVNQDTVYALVGPKPSLLREVIERAVSGTDRPLPPEERDYVQAIRAEPDARRKLALYATAVVATQRRLAPIYGVVREAAPSEPEVAELWRQISERRLTNMHTFIDDVQRAERLRPDVDISEAAHHVWVLNSPDVYLLLSEDRHWSAEEIGSWLTRTWERLLFP